MRPRLTACAAVIAIALSASIARGQTPEPSSVAARFYLQEEVFPQRVGSLQTSIDAGLESSDDGAIVQGTIGLELGVVPGLEVQAAMQLERAWSGRAGGLGSSSVGVLYGIVDQSHLGLTTSVGATFPSRSGLGDDVFSYQASVIGHLGDGIFHLQALVGAELQHGDDLEQQRSQRVRVDPRGALAAWVQLDAIAIVLESAAEPLPDRYAWRAGPTLLWQISEPFVLGVHGDADFGDDEVEYRGIASLVASSDLF